jgi:hypothetical protein
VPTFQDLRYPPNNYSHQRKAGTSDAPDAQGSWLLQKGKPPPAGCTDLQEAVCAAVRRFVETDTPLPDAWKADGAVALAFREKRVLLFKQADLRGTEIVGSTSTTQQTRENFRVRVRYVVNSIDMEPEDAVARRADADARRAAAAAAAAAAATQQAAAAAAAAGTRVRCPTAKRATQDHGGGGGGGAGSNRRRRTAATAEEEEEDDEPWVLKVREYMLLRAPGNPRTRDTVRAAPPRPGSAPRRWRVVSGQRSQGRRRRGRAAAGAALPNGDDRLWRAPLRPPQPNRLQVGVLWRGRCGLARPLPPRLLHGLDQHL